MREAIASLGIEAKAAAVSALHAKDVTALQAAKAKIQGVVPEIYKWSDEAKKQGYSDVELGDSLDAVGFPEVNSLQRNINEMLIIQQGSH